MENTDKIDELLTQCKHDLIRFPKTGGWAPFQIVAIWQARNFAELEDIVK
jgi:hypothetical protein